MSKNPTAVAFLLFCTPTSYFAEQICSAKYKKYDIHTFYGNKYVTIWTIRLKNALIWLAPLAIQHVVRTPLHLLISVVSFLTMAVIWVDYRDDIITEVLKGHIK
jgi:hypothetical protein